MHALIIKHNIENVSCFVYPVKVKVKVKQSLYRTGQAMSIPGGWSSQISRQSAHEGGKVVYVVC